MESKPGVLDKGWKFVRTIYIIEETDRRRVDRLAVILSVVFVLATGSFFFFMAQALYQPPLTETSARVAVQPGDTAVAGVDGTQPPTAQAATQAAGQAVSSAYPQAESQTPGTAEPAQPSATVAVDANGYPVAPSATPEGAQALPSGETAAATNTPADSVAATPTPGQGSGPTPTTQPGVSATPTLGVATRSKDGMVMIKIPAGTFMMGSEDSEIIPVWYAEMPVHEVMLNDYYIDQTEVTNNMYAKCVQDGNCTLPEYSESSSRSSYYGDAAFSNFPIIYVSWDQARSYCQWAGARLPSEAEWEKAARGNDGRIYAWGNTISCDQANYLGCKDDTTAVGSYPNGKSPYGLLDMVGNAYEWVNDWLDEGYYSTSPRDNPQGPTDGTFRVLRGGSWSSDQYEVRSAARGLMSPEYTDSLTGFRCARNP